MGDRLLRTRRIGEPREKLSYLVGGLRTLLNKANYIIREHIREYEEGAIVFTEKPRLPFLVYHTSDLYSTTCIVDLSGARLESISVKRATRFLPNVRVSVLIDDNRVHVYYTSLAEGLAYLFLPEVLREYRNGNVEVALGGSRFQDFIDIIVEFGGDLASKYNELQGSRDLFSRYYRPGIYVLKRYPGIDFSFIGLGYDDYSGNSYLLACNRYIKVVFKACINCDNSKGYSISHKHVEYLPVYREAVGLVKKKAHSIVDEYKELVKIAYLGVKAYAV